MCNWICFAVFVSFFNVNCGVVMWLQSRPELIPGAQIDVMAEVWDNNEQVVNLAEMFSNWS
jgi:hypothetical protein